MLRAPAKDFTGNCSQVIHSITKLFSFLVFFLLGGGSGNTKIGEEKPRENILKKITTYFLYIYIYLNIYEGAV